MEHHHPSLIGPLILITIGVLFLLANLGLLPLSFWELAARFWPLVLILLGLEIIVGRRSLVGALVVVVLWLALVGGVIWFSIAGGALLPGNAVTIEQIAQPLVGIDSAAVNLNVGAATTNVTALAADDANLMSGVFTDTQGTRIVKTYAAVGSQGRLAVSQEGTNVFPFNPVGMRWDIGLNPHVPIALSVNGGVGQVNLDLTALRVTSLSIDAGVGAIDVSAPASGVSSLSVDGGVGTATVTVPNGVAASIRVNSGLGGIRVNEARFPKFGDTYQSGDYASAANKIDIRVDGGVGSITIQ